MHIAQSKHSEPEQTPPNQAWNPERDTSSASKSHATGQIERCFAMKANLMSLPSQSRLRPFLEYRAPPSAWRPHAASGRSPAAPLHLAMARKGLVRIGGKVLHLPAQHVLMDIQIPSRLRYTHTPFLDQADSLDLELSPKVPSLHENSGLIKTPYLGVHQTGSSSS